MRTLASVGLLLAATLAAALAATPARAGCSNTLMDRDGDEACLLYDEPGDVLGAACGIQEATDVDECPGNVDRDHDHIPDVLEPFLCVLEDGTTPGDGTCSGGDYRVPQ